MLFRSNLDLMYALPGQTLAMARADIDAAASLGVPHVSAYQLTLEPNTVFHANPPVLPPHDLAADMQVMVEEKLAEAGYGHYEVSAFARPGRRCRHNLNYWEFGDYLGIGAGAHSKLSMPGRAFRQARFRLPREYMQRAAAGNAVQSEATIKPADATFEFMMNALRLTGGFALRLFEERAGLPVSSVVRELDAAEQKGLIRRDHLRVEPTELGRRFLNDLLQLFLRD